MKKFVAVFVSIMFLLTACSEESAEKSADNPTESKVKAKPVTNEKDDKQEQAGSSSADLKKLLEEAPEVPESISGLVFQYAGTVAGESIYGKNHKDTVEEIKKQFEGFPANASNEELDQLFNYLYSLVAEDFPDPQSLIDKWEMNVLATPDSPDSRLKFKENYNIEIILDASGSMAQKVDGKTKMELAKEAIKEFLDDAPKEANVSLRIYGHKGTGADADKKESCSSSELVYGMEAYNEEEFIKALDQFNPAGWTPIAHSLNLAQQDLSKFDGKTNTNMVFLVSDGIETCDGDPVAAARSLAESNISPIVNVIGFDVDAKGQKQMREVAKAAKGVYTTANNQKELKAEFDRAKEILERWEEWKQKAIWDAEDDEVRRSFEIIGFSNDWSMKETNQGNNLDGMIVYLSNNDVITQEQKSYLKDKAKLLDQFVEETSGELKADLENLNMESLEQTKKMIEEKYQENVN